MMDMEEEWRWIILHDSECVREGFNQPTHFLEKMMVYLILEMGYTDSKERPGLNVMLTFPYVRVMMPGMKTWEMVDGIRENHLMM